MPPSDVPATVDEEGATSSSGIEEDQEEPPRPAPPLVRSVGCIRLFPPLLRDSSWTGLPVNAPCVSPPPLPPARLAADGILADSVAAAAAAR